MDYAYILGGTIMPIADLLTPTPPWNDHLYLFIFITALHCCKAHAKINRKMGNLTPCKIVTPKISSWNFAHVIRSASLAAMQILISIGTVGASPQIGEILPPCDFFLTVLSCRVLSCPYLFSRSAGPIFTLYGSNDVFPRKDGPFGS